MFLLVVQLTTWQICVCVSISHPIDNIKFVCTVWPIFGIIQGTWQWLALSTLAPFVLLPKSKGYIDMFSNFTTVELLGVSWACWFLRSIEQIFITTFSEELPGTSSASSLVMTRCQGCHRTQDRFLHIVTPMHLGGKTGDVTWARVKL